MHIVSFRQGMPLGRCKSQEHLLMLPNLRLSNNQRCLVTFKISEAWQYSTKTLPRHHVNTLNSNVWKNTSWCSKYPDRNFWSTSKVDYCNTYTHWTQKLSPHFLFSTVDPIVNMSCKNSCVGSLNWIFHPNVMVIYIYWHKLTSLLNRILIDRFSIVLFWD